MSSTMNCVEVMKALRCSRSTVKAMLDRGELRGFRRGNLIRIVRASVERLLDGPATPGEVRSEKSSASGSVERGTRDR